MTLATKCYAMVRGKKQITCVYFVRKWAVQDKDPDERIVPMMLTEIVRKKRRAQ